MNEIATTIAAAIEEQNAPCWPRSKASPAPADSFERVDAGATAA